MNPQSILFDEDPPLTAPIAGNSNGTRMLDTSQASSGPRDLRPCVPDRCRARRIDPALFARAAACAVVLLLAWARPACAGPPFITDDPEPVELQHWEVYVASMTNQDPTGHSGTLPHVEVNYGPAPNLQLHVIMPFAFSAPGQGITNRGYGDTELGMKYRFIQESANRPMVGIFPLLEVPTGDATRGLGSGHLQVFLPVWLQKGWGPWLTYGGGGYWINPGAGNRNYWLAGWLLQRDLNKHLTLGNEFYYTTPTQDGGSSRLNFNAGGQYNFDEGHHLLFSAGRSIKGDTALTTYVAYQWTFGARSKEDTENGANGGENGSENGGKKSGSNGEKAAK